MNRFCLIFSLFPWLVEAQDLVPLPVSIERGEGVAMLVPYPAIELTDSELTPLKEWAAGHIPAGRVVLSLDAPAHIPAEGYRLSVKPEKIVVAGRDYGGVWNGLQTLYQLLTPDFDGTLPLLTIEDWPAMEYRGVMLDVARTFVPKEEVMRLIDNISRLKINKLHWHLADDEGWRVEIKSLPRLTEVGGFRGPGKPLHAIYGAWERVYGGFYTQDEVREVVAYAAVRNVEIIPEIDLPGHSRAAATAYPSILCDYEPNLAASAGYDLRNVFCVAREENYEMLEKIISELSELFPSSVMHLGGDEVMTGQWKQCTDCQVLMRQNSIGDAKGLQDVFMARVIDIAAKHGKRAGVWNEAAASGKIPKSTLVWGWESPEAARKIAVSGYPTVFCAGNYFYFDMRQSPRDIGHIWAGVVSLERVYSFAPEAVGLTSAQAENIRGVEATFFTELLLENGMQLIDYQLFPRACALAEVGWTPVEKRGWAEFQNRLKLQLRRLEAAGVKYRAAAPQNTDNQPIKIPAATFTSSMTASVKYPFGGVANHKTAARTTAACREGDWFMWRWANPVVATEISVKTGHGHLQRAGVPIGRVEISYDGRTFEQAGELRDLKVKIAPLRPFRAVKIVSESHGNGDNTTIVQPLIMR